MVCGCVCLGMMTQLMEQNGLWVCMSWNDDTVNGTNGLWVCMSWNDDTVNGTKWFVGVYVLE